MATKPCNLVTCQNDIHLGLATELSFVEFGTVLGKPEHMAALSPLFAAPREVTKIFYSLGLAFTSCLTANGILFFDHPPYLNLKWDFYSTYYFGLHSSFFFAFMSKNADGPFLNGTWKAVLYFWTAWWETYSHFSGSNILFLWTLTSITTVVENSVLDTNVCNELSRREIKGTVVLYQCNQKYSSHLPFLFFFWRGTV